MYLYSQAELTASRQPASISTYAVHAPSTSPPWDRGLLKYSSSSPPPAASLLTTSPSPVTMAQLVNQQMVILPAGANPNGKDSRWLTLEVCREYQRSKCSRSDNECKFAHPPAHVEVQNGRVVACFDSIKGKCQRKDPPCKYLHPPQHLREQLLQNGRNNLILKNLQLQAFHQQAQYGVLPVAGTKTVAVPTVIPGQFSYLTHYPGLQTLSAVPAQPPTTGYNPFITTSLASVAMQPNAADATSVMTQSMIPATAKAVRADKFESTSENGDPVTSHASLMDTFSFPYIPQSTLPGMIPAYKRIAVGDISKGGYPVYQTNPLMSPLQPASLMQLQQPAPYIPMSCEYAMYATYLYPTDSAHVQPTMLAPTLGPTLMPSTTPSTTTSSSVSTAAVSTDTSMTVNNHSGHSIIATTTTAPPSSMYLPANLSSSGAVRLPTVPNNAYYVEYFGSNKQLRDTLPVCQDFKCGQCNSPYCKQVHLSEDYVEVNNGYVTVCRDYATRQSCKRSRCKYYHIPIDLPPS